MVLHAIAARRAVRSYTSTPVTDAELTDILKAAQFAPTSRNNRWVQFVVVRDASTKASLFAIGGQEFLMQAPLLLVPVTDPAKTGNPVQDLSLASQNIFLQAAELGLGTVWKNLTQEQVASVKKELGIPPEMLVINIIPLGHPAEAPEPYSDAAYDRTRVHEGRW